MRNEGLADDAAEVAGLAGEDDFLRLSGAPFRDAEEEAEAGWILFRDRADGLYGLGGHARVLLVSEQQRQAEQHVAGDGAAGRRGVVEEVLRARDQFLVIDRCVEEAAPFFIAEAGQDLIGEL